MLPISPEKEVACCPFHQKRGHWLRDRAIIPPKGAMPRSEDQEVFAPGGGLVETLAPARGLHAARFGRAAAEGPT